MPTYDYRCTTCGKKFEWFQSISSEPLEHCPLEVCQADDDSMRGKGEVQRIVSGGAGLVFKGEGFYLTDYARKKDSKNGSDSGGGGETDGGESSGSSSDATSDSSGTASGSGEKNTNGTSNSGGTSSSSGSDTPTDSKK